VEVPDYRSLDGVEVTNQDGERLGNIDGLFVDDQLEVPTWVAVHNEVDGHRASAGAVHRAVIRSEGTLMTMSTLPTSGPAPGRCRRPHAEGDRAVVRRRWRTVLAQ
jgi:hypothetical protein